MFRKGSPAVKFNKTILISIAVIALAIPAGFIAAQQDPKTSIAETSADHSAIADMKAAYQANISQLEQTSTTASKEVNQLRKNKADTPEININYTNLLHMMKRFNSGTIIEDFHQDIQTPTRSHTSNPEIFISDMDIITRNAITTFNEDVKTWTKTVDAENSRIGKLIANGQETDKARILRLQTEMGLVFAVKIGECTNNPEAAWGCYDAGDEFYSITPSGLTVDDCHLRTTLAHEYRHYLQWVEGYMEGDNIQTREWLEADARDWEWHGGGC